MLLPDSMEVTKGGGEDETEMQTNLKSPVSVKWEKKNLADGILRVW